MYLFRTLDGEKVKEIQNTFSKGMRIKLCYMKLAKFPYGLEGIIDHVDEVGLIYVNWENGSNLPLDPKFDLFYVIR